MSKLEPIPSYTNGNVAQADVLYDFMYSPLEPSLEVINGRLDEDNIKDSDTRLYNYTEIQQHSLTGAYGIAGTANLDYFGGGSAVPLGSGFFRNGGPATESRYIAVPGSSIQFYLPFKSRVLLTWTICFINDNELDNNQVVGTESDRRWSQVNLFVDGTPTGTITNSPESTRLISGSMGDQATGGSKAVYTNPRLQDRYKNRFWSGHYFAEELPAGYHSASLRVCAHGTVKQTRIRARSMNCIFFKHGAT
tara:strand:+ start:11656 stop:12405 length:750 start_codon:yes stop_codon:yes gene_type:complete